MATLIGRNDYGDKLFFDNKTNDGYARGHIVTVDGNRLDVPNIASLIYRGYGWKLNRTGRKTSLMPDELAP
jgi:hypothetical protein